SLPCLAECFETSYRGGTPADLNLRAPQVAVAPDSDGVAHALLVVLLLAVRGPTAVFRRVIPVVVQAIKRIRAPGPRPHIGQKRHEIVPAAFAPADAAAAITGEIGMTSVAATRDHAVPGVVFVPGKFAPPAGPETVGHGRIFPLSSDHLNTSGI